MPSINRDIWDALPKAAKEADLSVQHTQFLLHKGLTPLVQLMNSLCQAGDMGHLRLAADAFKVMALTSCNLSQHCKELVGLDLEGLFKRLASSANPVTSQLFRDDLPKLVKDIKDTQLARSWKDTREQTQDQESGTPERSSTFFSGEGCVTLQ